MLCNKYLSMREGTQRGIPQHCHILGKHLPWSSKWFDQAVQPTYDPRIASAVLTQPNDPAVSSAKWTGQVSQLWQLRSTLLNTDSSLIHQVRRGWNILVKAAAKPQQARSISFLAVLGSGKHSMSFPQSIIIDMSVLDASGIEIRKLRPYIKAYSSHAAKMAVRDRATTHSS